MTAAKSRTKPKRRRDVTLERAASVRLDTLERVLAEQGRLYRMLFSPVQKLTKADWTRARYILIDARDTLVAKATEGKPPGPIVNNNTLVVSNSLPRTAELLARFASPVLPAAGQMALPDGSVLPDAVHPGQAGHGAPVAVLEVQGSREKP
jgi:hypothetical protein